VETQPILHIVRLREWCQAAGSGAYAPASLAREGFIHCSFASQVTAVADANFPGVKGLALLVIDPQRLGAEVRLEGPGVHKFPHIYGALRPEAVVAVLPFEPGPDGRFELPVMLRRCLEALP